MTLRALLTHSFGPASGAAFGLVRVIASLVNEPRTDGDAQRPLPDDDTMPPSTLPAAGGPTSSAAAGLQVEDAPQTMAPHDMAPEAGGGKQPVAEVPHSVDRAAGDADIQQPADSAAGREDAGPTVAAQPLGAPVAGTDGAAEMCPPSSRPADGPESEKPPAAGNGSTPMAGASAAAGPPGTPAEAASSVLRGPELTEAAPEADPHAALMPGMLAAPQPLALTAPQPAAVPAPQGVAQAAELSATVVSAEPPRPQPPPPPQLLLASADASAEEVQAAALNTFRELYPIFEPFQARRLGFVVPHLPYQPCFNLRAITGGSCSTGRRLQRSKCHPARRAVINCSLPSAVPVCRVTPRKRWLTQCQ